MSNDVKMIEAPGPVTPDPTTPKSASPKPATSEPASPKPGAPEPATPKAASPPHANGRQYTEAQRHEVNRVLNCRDWDHYEILGIKPSADEAEIRKAWAGLSKKIHPDKNADKDTNIAFHRVNEAKEVLLDPTKKAAHDLARPKYEQDEKNMPKQTFGEGFASNAFGDSDGDSDSDPDDGEHEIEPDDFIREIYETATPHVKKLLKKHTDGDSLQAINNLNQQIKAHNQQEGLKNDESCSILTNALVGIASDFATLKASLKNTPNDQVALGKVASLDEQLEKIRRKNHYPEDWTLNLSTAFRNSVRQQRSSEESSSVSMALSETRKGKQRENGSGTSTKVAGMTGGSATSKSDRKGLRNETSSPGKPYWEPGMTDDGEKILGYKPYYRTIRKTGETDLYGVQFVVERRGASNPIVLLSGTEVGNRVKDAYLGLPEDQKNDIRYSDQRYSHEDADRFEELLGWATKAMASVAISEPITRYPPGYGLVKFKTGDNDILSRTALRKILGTRDADKEIAKFDPRKLQRPGKGQRTQSAVQHDLEGSIYRARRDLEDVGDPDSLFVPERKSRRSREPQLTLAQEPANAELQDLVDLLFSELKKVNSRLDKTGRSDEDQLQASSLQQRFASLRG